MSRMGRRDSGQVLVIFAGGLLTLLVIAALVIDLGFTMAIRRSEQDAADAGAIAAARFIRTGAGGTAEPTKMRQAACFYAEQNGFDHIVVGTGGKGAVSRMMLGSVSRDVASRAHCPVTVAR